MMPEKYLDAQNRLVCEYGKLYEYEQDTDTNQLADKDIFI